MAMSEWISVKDRLPEGNGEIYGENYEESEMVMIYGKDPYGIAGYGIARCIYDHTDREDKGGWSGTLGDDWVASMCFITHWMPLPEPPKEDEA